MGVTMKITFLGTRGYIQARSRRHYRHASTLVEYKGFRLLVDCGQDWLGKFQKNKPDAILLTHAHPDHAWGLKEGAPCPVYATKVTLGIIKKYPIEQPKAVKPGKKYNIGPFLVEPFFVIHSLRCPAVGYRITANDQTIFIAHDIISIPERSKALFGCNAYIGDGASITRPIIRRKGDKIFGHTTVRAQIGWCAKEKVSYFFITHCGSQIVEGDGRTLGALVRKMGRESGVNVKITYDGLRVQLK